MARNTKILKRIIPLEFSVFLFLIAGCTSTKKVPAGFQQKIIFVNVTPREAYSLIKKNHKNPNFIILDVRTPHEYKSGHIKNAVNLNYHSRTFKTKLSKYNRNKIYLVYCASGHRSKMAVNLMKKLSFKKVYNILGGINAWRRGKLPLTISGK